MTTRQNITIKENHIVAIVIEQLKIKGNPTGKRDIIHIRPHTNVGACTIGVVAIPDVR